MKGKNAILIGAALFLAVAAGCSASAEGVYHPEPPCNAECEAEFQANIQANIEYYKEKLPPTRDDALRIRECVTERTGYDEFPVLPAEFEHPSQMPRLGTPVPAERIEEDMPFRLVERMLVAVGQRKPLQERVNIAETDCVWDLGLEDRYYPPWTRKHFRPSNS